MYIDNLVISPGWRKFAAMVLGLVIVGLPVNNLPGYALLTILVVCIVTGEVSARCQAWLIAVAAAAVIVTVQVLVPLPRIQEGHNVFLPGGPQHALERGLPTDVFHRMKQEFDTLYPPSVRCARTTNGCWRSEGYPTRTYAFSADSVWHKARYSRSVTALDFSDPVWLRLGFINQIKYNWYTPAPDVHRSTRDRRFWMGLHRWHLAMPWFEMIRLPAAFVGGKLCWRGEIMWEGAHGRYRDLPGPGCRTVGAADSGRHVFGLAIKPDTLAMQLEPPWTVWLAGLANAALVLAGALVLLGALVRVRRRPAMLALVLIGLAVLVIAIDDASFLGGVRPFGGGNDGLFYDGVGRIILQHLLAGNIHAALRGGESIYWYGGPGLRYFRALEHIFFGESYLGYLSLVLLMPFLVYRLFLRFLPRDWSLTLVFMFTAVPIGTIFGTCFVNYEMWAARGFADPAAYILFIAGIIPLVGATAAGPGREAGPAFAGALLLVLGIFMKPVIAPAAAVLLIGSGLVSLRRREWARLTALCIGSLPVFSMALHNWYFGHKFVLFSSNEGLASLLVMPPSAYLAAAHELISFNFSGGYCLRALTQIANWLSDPAESYFTIPINATAVVILAWVVMRGSEFDPWLRLVGGSTLVQHTVALFYKADTARYYFLTWFLTMLVVVVFFQRIGIDRLKQHFPFIYGRVSSHRWMLRIGADIRRLQKAIS